MAYPVRLGLRPGGYKETRIGLKMKLIPAGSFTMGSPKTEPDRRDDEVQHKVTISKPFYMGIYEVTQKQYYDLMLPDGKIMFSSTRSEHTVLSDGRIMYHRWEYIAKGARVGKTIWTMHPDGGMSQELYGVADDTTTVYMYPPAASRRQYARGLRGHVPLPARRMRRSYHAHRRQP